MRAYAQFMVQQLKLARTDLANDLGIQPGEVGVVKARDIEWQDASAGCGDLAKPHAAEPAPGLIMVFSAEGKTYEYHSLGNGKPFLCADPAQEAKDALRD